jgi:ferrous iron transport protein A
VNLSEVPVRETVTVAGFTLCPDEQRRLTELGLRRGALVEVLRRAPFGGPLAVRVAGSRLALRLAQARRITVSVPLAAATTDG